MDYVCSCNASGKLNSYKTIKPKEKLNRIMIIFNNTLLISQHEKCEQMFNLEPDAADGVPGSVVHCAPPASVCRWSLSSVPQLVTETVPVAFN